jgi:nickel-dependent lactate racemase
LITEQVSQAGYLSNTDVKDFILKSLAGQDLAGQKVLVLIPDRTRTMPLPLVFEALREGLVGKAAALDFLVALGTHPKLSAADLGRLLGHAVIDGRIGESRIFNHAWDDPDSLRHIGTISSEDMAFLSEGKMTLPVPVRINARVFSYDHLLICGPVFPHEVVGFSGGNKYFFPGVSGPEVINITHWLGALLTNYAVIGSGYTPVRAVIDRAAAMIDRPKSCFAFVVDHDGTAGVFFGGPEEAWEKAASLSARRHIHLTGQTFQRVIAVMPEMYDDLWVGGKGMYKLEPVVADGGELVIYAPHIDTISVTHGAVLREIGYHVCPYFLAQWERFMSYPWSVLAHSTHVRGLGRYDPQTGIESPRIQVTLATGIPEDLCREINLGYQNPSALKIADLEDREDEGVLVVHGAGEQLFRVK